MGTQQGIRIFHTAEHPCGYWPDRLARDLVLDPVDPALPVVYGPALARGFRRSGGHVYKPHCDGCRACIAVRVPVVDFVASRAQRRCIARNADLSVDWSPPLRSEEIFALYRRYLEARHAGGGMDTAAPADFDQFLACAWSKTRFLEFRRAGELLAVAATDVLPTSLSAIYTFFEPTQAPRGLGSFAILSQIEQARRAGLAHVYLGFWLDGHPKMDYKRRYRPLEWFDGRGWQRSDPG